MGSDNRAQFAVIVQTGIGNKFAHIGFVGAPGFAIGDIGQPFLFGRHVGKPLEVGAGQRLFLDWNQLHLAPLAGYFKHDNAFYRVRKGGLPEHV